MQSIHELQGEIKECFTKSKESGQNGVERAFGVLQAKWEIVKNLVQ